MKTSVLSILFLLSCIFSVACSPVENNKSPGGSDASSTTPAEPSSATSALYLIVQSRYEKASESSITSEGECLIASTISGGASGSNVSCSINIPELRLHYSELRFTVGTSSSDFCAHISFTPYYFRKSDAVMLLAGGASTEPCNDVTNKNCYGGAAPNMIQKLGFEFPEVKGTYLLPSLGQLSAIYKLDSSNTRAIDNSTATTVSFDPTLSLYNINSANNLLTANRSVTVNNGSYDYQASTMQDYEVKCSDIYGESMYKITLTLGDMDMETAEGVSNTFYDWN